jgi:hypothetical protein
MKGTYYDLGGSLAAYISLYSVSDDALEKGLKI